MMFYVLFHHSLLHGHLDCFQSFVITNTAVFNRLMLLCAHMQVASCDRNLKEACWAGDYAHWKLLYQLPNCLSKDYWFYIVTNSSLRASSPFLRIAFVYAIPSHWHACPFLFFQISVKGCLLECLPSLSSSPLLHSTKIMSVRLSLTLPCSRFWFLTS